MVRVQAARLDPGHAGVEHGTGVALARTGLEVDVGRLHADDVTQQGPALALGQPHQGRPLNAAGPAINEHHCLRLAGLLDAERVAGGHHGHDAETVQLDVVEAALVDLPAEDGVLAAEIHFGVGEARSGPDVAGAGLDVMAADVGGTREPPRPRAERPRPECESSVNPP